RRWPAVHRWALAVLWVSFAVSGCAAADVAPAPTPVHAPAAPAVTPPTTASTPPDGTARRTAGDSEPNGSAGTGGDAPGAASADPSTGPAAGPETGDGAGDGATPDADPAAHEAEIARLLKEILAERGAIAAMQKERRRTLDDLDATRFALERSIAAWDAPIATAARELAAEQAAVAHAQARLDIRTQLHAQWLQTLQAYLAVLKTHIEHSVAYNRAARLKAVADALHAAQARDASPADVLARIAALQDAEEALGRTVETVPVAVAADRERDGLRLGALVLLAPDGQGGAVAVLPTAARPTAVPADQAAGIDLALQILQRRRSPDFTDLYVPALPPAAADAMGSKFDSPAPVPGDSGTAAAPRAPAGLAAPTAPTAPTGSDGFPDELPPIQTAAAPGTGGDEVVRLRAELDQLHAAEGQFLLAAATERQARLNAIDGLQKSENTRRAQLADLQAQTAKAQAEHDRLADRLQLAGEQENLFVQGLESGRTQLIERLNGSLEAAAQPSLTHALTKLQAAPDANRFSSALPAATGNEAGGADPSVASGVSGASGGDGGTLSTSATAAAADLLDTELRVYSAVLAGARTVTPFTMQVKRPDGKLVDAQCVQVSLLGGYFYDPGSGAAGLLVSDAKQFGRWQEQTKGLDVAEQAAIAARIQHPDRPGTLPVDVTGGAAIVQAVNQWDLVEWFKAGGVVMWPLLLVLIAGVVLVLERAAALLRLSVGTRNLLERVEAGLLEGHFAEAERLCDPARGPVQRVLHAALLRRRQSRAAIEDAMQAAALAEMPHLQKGLGMIALMAGLAPLLGLLGTVTGMIHTFQMVNLFGSGDTRFLAGGISEALITTEFGLVMAIPFVFCHGILLRLSEKILGTIELGAAIVVQRLSPVDPAMPGGPSAPSASVDPTAPTGTIDATGATAAGVARLVPQPKASTGAPETRPSAGGS
ncbi:MAG: MotA/TolQ/ExbB proton channel family protein, partial [Planctomycetota bacterium]